MSPTTTESGVAGTVVEAGCGKTALPDGLLPVGVPVEATLGLGVTAKGRALVEAAIISETA